MSSFHEATNVFEMQAKTKTFEVEDNIPPATVLMGVAYSSMLGTTVYC